MFHVKHPGDQSPDHLNQLSQLDIGLDMLGLTLSSLQHQQMAGYLSSLYFWTQKINLLSRGDLSRVVERHFLESLAWVPVFAEKLFGPVMDLGSGAGFPGVPLAVLKPNLPVVLVESIKKKARFLEQVVRKQGLNVRVHATRAEQLATQQGHLGAYGLVVARAVASIEKLLAWSGPLLLPGGHLLTFKGDKLDEEIGFLQQSSLPVEWGVERFQVPVKIAAQPGWQARHLLWVRFK